MGTPNAALFPNGLAVPDIDGANPSKLDPAGQVWEPREGWLRILGAWNINNVTRAPSPVPPTPAFGHIHISVPATLTGADPATTNPQAIMWNGAAWVDMTPVAYQCAMIKLGLPCAISTAAGNTVTVGPDGGIYVAGVSVPTVPLQTVSAPLVVTGTNIDIDFSLMSPADRMAIVAAICGDAAAKDVLADCLVSPDAGNALVSVGNGLFVAGSAASIITSVNGPLTVVGGVLDIDFCALTAADIACLRAPLTATQAQVDAGVDATAFVSPKTLHERATVGFKFVDTTQTMPSAVISTITSMSVSDNNLLDSVIAGNQITIGPRDAGYWVLALYVVLATSPINYASARIVVNGTVVALSGDSDGANPNWGPQTLTTVQKLNAGDIITIQYTHNHGSNLNTTSNGHFHGARLGAG